ncbi:MAG: hypothetical protein M3N46_03610 [Actinomycetota bacterium]|nr:hypothetical protein [Actinomycetota bacterium]
MTDSPIAPAERNGLLPGTTAHGWYLITVVVFVCFFGGLALVAMVSFTGFATGHPFTASEHPVAVYGWFLSFMVVVVMVGVTGFATPSKARRELLAGYSTLPLSTLTVDIRDPRDGRILLPAGEGPRYGYFRIGALRRDAGRFADRQVNLRTDEPGPIRTLEIPGGARGLAWGRARLRAFHAAIAAAEPDALLIDALRHPLVESAVAQVRPGARLHYTYLLAALPTGLQFWQDTEHPALIAEIPRGSIVDVVEQYIQNDQASLLGISVQITDPAGIPTELPFLPLRPRHPLLFVKRNDIPALIGALRQKWGMPPTGGH